MQIIKLTKTNFAETVKEAAAVLKQGGLVIFPSETSYGIAADALNESAVIKVHDAKQQPHDKPISVIVANTRQLNKIAVVNSEAKKLIKEFMPGPLTIIVVKRPIVPRALTESEIAIRISSNKFANALAEKFGGAITATSANIHGQPAIFSAEEAALAFENSVDLLIDSGNLPKAMATTIYCTVRHKILREGEIMQEQIEKTLKK
jgi:L-threonylcarbamoyladenylate synthase